MVANNSKLRKRLWIRYLSLIKEADSKCREVKLDTKLKKQELNINEPLCELLNWNKYDYL